MRILCFLAALLVAVPAAAHQETVAHSRMVVLPSGDVEYALKIPVEDLAESLGRDGHTPLDAPEVRGAEDLLFRQFLPLVGMTSGGEPCPVERSGIDVPEDTRLYGELRFVFHCPAGAPVALDYRVFFDVDPGHMGMLEVESAGGKTNVELIRERPRWEVDTSEAGPPQVRAIEVGADENTAALPTEDSWPIAGAQTNVVAPARPYAASVADVEEPAKAARSYGSWMLVAIALVVAAAAVYATRAARRGPS